MSIYVVKHKPTDELLPMIFSSEGEANAEIDMLCRLYLSGASDSDLIHEHLIFFSKRIFARTLFSKLKIDPTFDEFEVIHYEDSKVTKQLKLILHKKLESLFIVE